MARMRHLDDIDMRILKILARNSRTSIREIARELGLAVSTVHARLQRLISTGIIKKFTIIPDYDSLGYTISALMLLQVEGEKIIDAEKVLATEPNVIAVYDITGDYDVAVIARFRDVNDLDDFVKRINRIPFVKRTVTSIILRVTKEDIASPILSDN
ncbi:Lrp/AsnC family transcriptional regulator [Pyrofollis japonicus]|nr:Lrp/AsnC family transcriptional regulator [Pyrofollis japonicus]